MSHSPRKVSRYVASSRLAALILAAAVCVGFADAPAAPQLSSLVPAADLETAAQDYMTKITGFMADEATYVKNAEQLAQKANALAALAQTLGLHDGDNKWKGPSTAVMNSARDLARAKDFAAAHAAYDALKSAVDGGPAVTQAPKWEKFASLGKLMHETAEVNSRLRRNLRRFDRNKDDNAEGAAVLTAFAMATIYDTHEVKNPADMPKWYAMAVEMRDAAADLSKASHAGDEAGFKTALDRLGKSCDNCHEVFHAE